MKKLILTGGKAHIIGARIAKWYIDRYLRHRYSPLIVAIFTTNACNLKCDICSIWRGTPKATLTFDQLKKVVDATSRSACYLSFSGGEPLLVDDIMKMISYASARIPYVHLVSNGLLVTSAIARDLKRSGLTEITLSLDGEAEWHNKVRGSDKSFGAVMKAIEIFKTEAPGMPIVINTVIYPEALDQTKKAVELTKRLGVFHKVQPVNEHFDFETSLGKPRDLDFSRVDRGQVVDLAEYLLSCRHVTNSRYFLKQIPRYFDGTLVCGPTRPRCVLPRFFLEVNAYGKVSPCMYGTGWNGVIDIDGGLEAGFEGDRFKECQKTLEECRLCDKSMYMCYWESLAQFPLTHSVMYGS